MPRAGISALLTTELGEALRRARLRRGLTLRQMEVASHGRYKPSSIASYERGERKITAERLCLIAIFLRADPGRLVAEAFGIASIRSRGEVVIDLRDPPVIVKSIDEAERRRADERPWDDGRDAADLEGPVVLSVSDLEWLARELGRSPAELVRMLGAATQRDLAQDRGQRRA